MAGDAQDRRPREGQGEGAGEPLLETRVRAVWRTWLSALASDAEAATAAALAYESLPEAARDAWLDALEVDAAMIDVPHVALYAPLLGVEADATRRDRMARAIADDPNAYVLSGAPRAQCGVAADGTHACIVAVPLYLNFVQVLTCRYTPNGGFRAAHHQPLRHADDIERVREVDGIAVEPTPLRVVVEELAHAILADKRGCRPVPPVLASFARLFAPELGDSEGADSFEP